MEYTKVSKDIFDPIKANKAKFEEKFGEQLAELFPSAVKDGVVDFASLLSELGQYFDSDERYELNWAGKADAKRIANSDVVGKTLKFVPEDSKNPETTQNLYIEGDNLEVLQLLRNNYYNSIKMIYIDPPYNTGNDFIYRDRFAMDAIASAKAEGEIDNEGNRLIVNQKGGNRYHANWLNMIYPRLRVAHELLTDDGAIFISIDDNEVDNLKKVCNEIFGERNFVGQLTIVNNLKGRNDSKNIATCHEFLLIYGKSGFLSNGLPLTEEQKSEYNKIDERGNKYQLRDLRKRGRPDRREDRPNMYFPIYYNEVTKECSLDYHENWIEILPLRGDGSDGRWRWGRERVQANLQILEPKYSTIAGRWGIEHRVYLNPSMNPVLLDIQDELEDDTEESEERSSKSKSFWIGPELSTDVARRQFKELMGDVFDYPKSVDFLTKIIHMGSNPNSIVLDFFSGSASTAHAVMKINAEDGGNRKYIMVQTDKETCDEKSEAYRAGFKNICEIGKERIRRAGDKIIDEYKERPAINTLDVGFKVFKVTNTNIRWFSEAINSDILDYDMTMSDMDKLDFNPGFTDLDVVYEILLRHRDIPLSTSVEQLTDVGNRTYIFADTVVVCLEETITEDMISRIAAIEPMPTKIIFRDSAFGDDISLKENTMIRLEAQMRKNSGLEKRAYRVEFI